MILPRSLSKTANVHHIPIHTFVIKIHLLYAERESWGRDTGEIGHFAEVLWCSSLSIVLARYLVVGSASGSSKPEGVEMGQRMRNKGDEGPPGANFSQCQERIPHHTSSHWVLTTRKAQESWTKPNVTSTNFDELTVNLVGSDTFISHWQSWFESIGKCRKLKVPCRL